MDSLTKADLILPLPRPNPYAPAKAEIFGSNPSPYIPVEKWGASALLVLGHCSVTATAGLVALIAAKSPTHTQPQRPVQAHQLDIIPAPFRPAAQDPPTHPHPHGSMLSHIQAQAVTCFHPIKDRGFLPNPCLPPRTVGPAPARVCHVPRALAPPTPPSPSKPT